MSAVQCSSPEHSFRTLRTWKDPETRVHWCFMHARGMSSPRLCFSREMVSELLRYQRELANSLSSAATADELSHMVVASDVPGVFNLGGDLALFTRLIRARDRIQLLQYAQECVHDVYGFQTGFGVGAHTIALVQGDALGGGFEAALSCHTIVAERGARMGLPEVLFDLFPGMGAFSFLSRRIGPVQAERLMLGGKIYTSEELNHLELVDVIVEKDKGPQAVAEIVRSNRRIPHARRAMHRVRDLAQPVSLTELMGITEIWVDTALQLGEKSLRIMERLVRAQERRVEKERST